MHSLSLPLGFQQHMLTCKCGPAVRAAARPRVRFLTNTNQRLVTPKANYQCCDVQWYFSWLHFDLYEETPKVH